MEPGSEEYSTEQMMHVVAAEEFPYVPAAHAADMPEVHWDPGGHGVQFPAW